MFSYLPLRINHILPNVLEISILRSYEKNTISLNGRPRFAISASH